MTSEGEGPRGVGFRRWKECLQLLAVGPFLALVLQVGARVRFPWDSYIWSESPFLTNMLSLSRGGPIYRPPSDANSFVYSPGLEYLCHALLHPLRLDLDIRACRCVVLIIALTACVGVSRAGGKLLSELGLGARTVRAYVPFGFMLAALVLGRNYTADVCHPDDLMVAHVVLTFLLCLSAARDADPKRALGAVVFGSLGVLAKQTAAGTGFAALAGLLLVQSQFRKPRLASMLVSATLVTTCAAVAPMLVPANGRFWTLELLRSQGLSWEKFSLYESGVMAFSHRVLLYTVAPIVWVWLCQRPEAAARRFATLWLVFAIAACGPALAAYTKQFGFWNNLGLWDIWATLLIAPVLWSSLATCTDRPGGAEPESSRALFAATMGLFILLLCSVFPTRAWPSQAQYAAAREFDAELARAHAAHERVLVAHGTAALIHAGYLDVPLDRANSLLEIFAGKQMGRAFTRERILKRVYDRIYVNMENWYAILWPDIALGYEDAGVILRPSARAGANGMEQLGERFAYQFAPRFGDQQVHIYRRRASAH